MVRERKRNQQYSLMFRYRVWDGDLGITTRQPHTTSCHTVRCQDIQLCASCEGHFTSEIAVIAPRPA
eukprot:884933-Amphidinium_carterae.1